MAAGRGAHRAGALPGHDPARRRKMLPLADKNTLAGRASRAMGWSFASNALARFGTVGIGIALARLLGPRSFGTYAVAYVALIAVLSFNELGVSLAIVRWQGEPRQIAPTIMTISMVSSIAIYVGCFLGAPAFAAAMGAPAATSVIRVLALSVVIDGVTSTPAALLQRHFLQDKKAITDQVNCWLGAGLTIALAWYGCGAMSLAIGRLAGCLGGGILLVAFSPEPLRLGFDAAKARALLRFGLPLGGSSVIALAVVNVDQLVVGHLLGATALGCYVLACNLAGWPGNIFSQPVRAVAPAVFSRLQHDRKAMVAGFLNVAGMLCAVALPVCMLLSGSAVPLIGFVYGARWLPAAQALIWLGLLAALRIFFELVYDFFVVLARSRVVFLAQLAWLLALIPALIAGTRAEGIFGTAMAGSAVAAGLVLPWYLIELHRVGIRLRALVTRVWLPLAGAATAGLSAMAATVIAPSDLTALAASGIVTVLIIALLIYQMRAGLDLFRPTSGEGGSADICTSDTNAAGPDPAAQARTLALIMELAQSSRSGQDVTGQIPAAYCPADDPQSYREDRTAAPIYQQTVKSLRWDPGSTRCRDGGNGRTPHAANGHGRTVPLQPRS